ncbi:MAG: hypothetical protein ACK58T_22455, partial [Phycisphaerae bacterium]
PYYLKPQRVSRIGTFFDTCRSLCAVMITATVIPCILWASTAGREHPQVVELRNALLNRIPVQQPGTGNHLQRSKRSVRD